MAIFELVLERRITALGGFDGAYQRTEQRAPLGGERVAPSYWTSLGQPRVERVHRRADPVKPGNSCVTGFEMGQDVGRKLERPMAVKGDGRLPVVRVDAAQEGAGDLGHARPVHPDEAAINSAGDPKRELAAGQRRQPRESIGEVSS